eukprot:13794164-Heterocapsa_arctica.AAC.1
MLAAAMVSLSRASRRLLASLPGMRAGGRGVKGGWAVLPPPASPSLRSVSPCNGSIGLPLTRAAVVSRASSRSGS